MHKTSDYAFKMFWNENKEFLWTLLDENLKASSLWKVGGVWGVLLFICEIKEILKLRFELMSAIIEWKQIWKT